MCEKKVHLSWNPIFKITRHFFVSPPHSVTKRPLGSWFQPQHPSCPPVAFAFKWIQGDLLAELVCPSVGSPGPVQRAVGWSRELREELLHLPKGDLLEPTVAWTHRGLDPPWPGTPWPGPPVVWTPSGLDPQSSGHPVAWTQGPVQMAVESGTALWAALSSLLSRPWTLGLRQLILSGCLSFGSVWSVHRPASVPFPIRYLGQVQSPVPPLPCSHAGPLTLFCARVFNCVHSRNIYGATAVCPTLCETLGIQRWRWEL